MEKMYVYPETVESAIEAETAKHVDSLRSKADIVGYQSKLYRAFLQQGVGSRTVSLRQVTSRSATLWDQISARVIPAR